MVLWSKPAVKIFFDLTGHVCEWKTFRVNVRLLYYLQWNSIFVHDNRSRYNVQSSDDFTVSVHGFTNRQCFGLQKSLKCVVVNNGSTCGVHSANCPVLNAKRMFNRWRRLRLTWLFKVPLRIRFDNVNVRLLKVGGTSEEYGKRNFCVPKTLFGTVKKAVKLLHEREICWLRMENCYSNNTSVYSDNC